MEQVLIYSTECVYPLAVLGNMHYAHINDLSWDFKGQKLLGASSDGYISVISFEGDSHQEILGDRLPLSEIPEKLRPQFEALDTVTFKKNEDEAKDPRKNQIKTVSFKSKNAGGVVVNPVTIVPNNNNP